MVIFMKKLINLCVTTSLIAFSFIPCCLLATKEGQKPYLLEETNQRDKDLEIIVRKSLFDMAAFDQVLEVFAAEILQHTDKTMAVEELIRRFHESIKKKENLKKFYKPYAYLFSDKEIQDLRAIYENEIYIKYVEHTMEIVQAQLEEMKQLMEKLTDKFGVERQAEIVSVDCPVISLTKENFLTEVESSSQPVIVDIYADWCRPCRNMAPIFEELAQDYAGICKFAKANFDSQSEIAESYEVHSLPTILYMKDGQVIMRTTGSMSKEDFTAKIKEFLGKIL
jgi:thioredoxin 1